MRPSLTPNQVLQFSYFSSGNEASLPSYVQVGRKIGFGGMASVYGGVMVPPTDFDSISHTDLNVAVKAFDPSYMNENQEPDFLMRFEREGLANSRLLRHDNIIPFLGSGLVSERHPFHVLGLHRGRSLKSVISNQCHSRQFLHDGLHYGAEDTNAPPQDRTFKPEHFILSVGCDISSALDHAHQNGIIHRDVKPANIMLTVGEGFTALDVKLTDFGISKIVGSGTMVGKTRIGSTIGTVDYMPFEQVMGYEVGFDADTFSLGVILYELATGRRLLSRWPNMNGPGELSQYMLLLQRLPFFDPGIHIPTISPGLRQIIIKATSRERKDRFSDGGELHKALCALTSTPSTNDSIALAQTIYPPVYDSNAPDSGRPPPDSSERPSDSDLPTPIPSAPRLPERVFQEVVQAPELILSVHAPKPEKLPDVGPVQSIWKRPWIFFVVVLMLSLGVGIVWVLRDDLRPSTSAQSAKTERKQKVATPLAPLPSASVRPPLPAENIIPLEKNNKYHFGVALMKQKQWKEARDNFLDALQLTSNAPEIYRQLYAVSLKLGETEKAREYFAKGLELEREQK